MDSRERDRLRVKAIDVSLQSALRHVDDAGKAKLRAKASRLYDEARDVTADAAVIAEIDRLQVELEGDVASGASGASTSSGHSEPDATER